MTHGTQEIEGIDPYEEKRPWGSFRRFTDGMPSTVKTITVNAGETLSLQNHGKRAEFWHILSGHGFAEIENAEHILEMHEVKKGTELSIPIGAKHRIGASPDSSLEFLEISVGEFDESDIVRYEDRYGRSDSKG
jgi:mannose-6-phosphate isomerase